jgi:hypothetical protein
MWHVFIPRKWSSSLYLSRQEVDQREEPHSEDAGTSSGLGGLSVGRKYQATIKDNDAVQVLDRCA